MEGLSFRVERLWAHNFPEDLIRRWVCGEDIILAQKTAPNFDVKSYSSVTLHAYDAGSELDRIVSTKKALFYPVNIVPPYTPHVVPGLNIAPGLIIARKNRLRYVTDWSNPDADLNQMCEPVDTNYRSIADFIHHLRPGALMFGLDLIDCFSHWLIKPHQRRYFGFRHPLVPTTGTFTFLPQGFAPSPGINDRNVKDLIQQTYLRFPGTILLDFVDDIRGVLTDARATSKPAADAVMKGIVDLWSDIGIRLHGPGKPDKYITPSTNCDWIGYTFDTADLFLEIINEKRLEIISNTEQFAAQIQQGATIKALQLASAIGSLRWVSIIIPEGAIFLKKANTALVNSGALKAWQIKPKPKIQPDPIINNPASFIEELHWWCSVLKSRPKIKIFYSAEAGVAFTSMSEDVRFADDRGADTSALFATAHIDASAIGWGVSVYGRVAAQGKTYDRGECPNTRELATLKNWLTAMNNPDEDQLSDVYLSVRTDNTVTQHYLNYTFGNIPHLTALAIEIKRLAAIRSIRIWADHTPGALNVVADSLSRFTTKHIPRDNHPDRFLAKTYWESIMGRLKPQPDTEIFATPDRSNARLFGWSSPINSIFDLAGSSANQPSWTTSVSWWFPPNQLLFQTLKYLSKFLKIPAPSRPIFYILVEVKGARFAHLIVKFRTVITFRSKLYLFNTGTIQNPTKLDLTQFKHVVLASV